MHFSHIMESPSNYQYIHNKKMEKNLKELFELEDI